VTAGAAEDRLLSAVRRAAGAHDRPGDAQHVRPSPRHPGEVRVRLRGERPPLPAAGAARRQAGPQLQVRGSGVFPAFSCVSDVRSMSVRCNRKNHGCSLKVLCPSSTGTGSYYTLLLQEQEVNLACLYRNRKLLWPASTGTGSYFTLLLRNRKELCPVATGTGSYFIPCCGRSVKRVYPML